jgi:hypothetical protein
MPLDRDTLKERALTVLQRHVGKPNAITMTRLTAAIQGGDVIPSRRYDESRLTRSIISQLRAEGHPIAHTNGRGGGYFFAATEAELEETAAWFRSRAMSAFRQEANLKRISLSELVEQLKLDIETPRMTDRLDELRTTKEASSNGTTD